MLECPTCGQVFSEVAVQASVMPLADLEPTLMSVGEVRVQADPDLEPTAVGAVGTVALEAFPDLEVTVIAPVKAAAEVMPDLEPTALGEADMPTEESVRIRCRYCGNEGQADGLFCDRCGMRLPREGTAKVAAVRSLTAGRKCRACGSHDFSPEGKCMECGVMLSQES
jgi:hypothetical protein